MHTHSGTKYKKNRFDPQKLEVLAELRKRAGLCQRDVAEFFNMTDYNSVAAWELGKSKPLPFRRERFIIYLLDKLLLRRNAEQFRSVWDDVMVNEWGWKSLSDIEWQNAFPGHEPEALNLTLQHPSHVKPITDRETELVQLNQLLVDIRAIVGRLLDGQAGQGQHLPETPSHVERH